ncbi:MAG: metallophosphatase [Gloeocapsa sp. DLM2.Bin57]|nr:MAG: metallophosphatase [Gloeocapsa sp. DLM2.Bin57]
MWAILAGIEGNYPAYQAVLKDIKSQTKAVEELYILGDIVGPRAETETLVQSLLNPFDGELFPQICRGWWEEQCLILHGLSGTTQATELLDRYGDDTVKNLWNFVSRETVEWIRKLDFGFVELDCLLIHGSGVSVSEELTPNTPPWRVLDRLGRFGVNQLFCGRSGQIFEYQLQQGSIISSVTTLENQSSPETITTSQKRIIGVGNVGKTPHQATYTLYNSHNNYLEFRVVYY